MIKNYTSVPVQARGTVFDGTNGDELRELLGNKLLQVYEHPDIGTIAVIRDRHGDLHTVHKNYLVLVSPADLDCIYIYSPDTAAAWQ